MYEKTHWGDHTMTVLSASVDHLVAFVEARSGTMPELQQDVYDIVQKATHATQQERETALQRMTVLVSSIPLFPAALIAMGCGALIEKGADPAIASTTILQRAQEALQKASAFGRACQNEARRHPGDSDPDDIEVCVKQYSQHLAQDMPEEAQAWFVLEPICSAALAVLMRLPRTRETIRRDPAFLAVLAACPAQNAALQCVRDVLDVLEHEEMVVLHPTLKRGYRIRISGIGDNFQLHTLLADA